MNSATEAAPSFAGLSLDKPRLFGVINVTPDSFSDGGEALALSEALKRGWAMLDDGADILDVGENPPARGPSRSAPRKNGHAWCRWSRG